MSLKSRIKASIVTVLGHERLDSIRRQKFLWLVGRGRLLPRESEMALLHQLVPAGSTALDIGANYGVYTHSLSQLVAAEGAVHSFEPLLVPYSILIALVKRRKLTNVTLHNVALSDVPGEATVQIPTSAGSIREYGKAWLEASAHTPTSLGDSPLRVPVRTTTLDTFAETTSLRSTSFVKCDVEGAELNVLRGGEQFLARFRPVILCEVEESYTSRFGYRGTDVFSWIGERLYCVFKLTGDRIHRVDFEHPAAGNYFFVPNEYCTRTPWRRP